MMLNWRELSRNGPTTSRRTFEHKISEIKTLAFVVYVHLRSKLN